MNLDLGPAFTRAQTVVNGLIAAIPSIVVALVVFAAFPLLGAIVTGVVARLRLARVRAHRNAGMAVGRLAQGLVLFVGLLVALSVALPTFRPGDVVQVLGISSVAIGFAFRDILQNILAGILLLVTQPFRIGDQIVTGTHEGTVEDIQTRATFIRTYDGQRVVIKHQLVAHGIDLPFPTQQILFHDQTEDSDGDRGRQREGWPAGNADVPASRKVADAIAQLSRFKPRGRGDE